jgi:glycosyltransferase involved in cell wall biosynthesis
MTHPDSAGRLSVVILNWRDTAHPEGGGSERYIETVAAGLAAAGHRITLYCAWYEGAPAEETWDGVRIVRGGGKLSVYPKALWALASGRLGRPDVVVDVQNGLPFWSRLVTRAPVVVLVHHVHREQWRVIYRGIMASVGWWMESRLAPRVYRRSRYVTVSGVTRDELSALRVGRERCTVIHNGTSPAPDTTSGGAATPRICVLGRLVPHKRVEHVLTAVAELRPRWPTLKVSVVGDGWWADELRLHAHRLAVDDIVEFCGHVDEQRKHEELARSWLLAAPSLKEGWGLVVVEAATHQVPTVGYRYAGGLAESVIDGETGILVEDFDGFVAAIERLLTNGAERQELGRAAARYARKFHWNATVQAWEQLLAEVTSARHNRPRRRTWPT